MIPSIAATGLLALVIACARWRGRRLVRRHAAAVIVEVSITRRADERADRLRVQLHAAEERLVCAEQDRDASRLVASGHLRRAWRAERALAAVRARDEQAAYREAEERRVSAATVVAVAEQITRAGAS